MDAWPSQAAEKGVRVVALRCDLQVEGGGCLSTRLLGPATVELGYRQGEPGGRAAQVGAGRKKRARKVEG